MSQILRGILHFVAFLNSEIKTQTLKPSNRKIGHPIPICQWAGTCICCGKFFYNNLYIFFKYELLNAQ